MVLAGTIGTDDIKEVTVLISRCPLEHVVKHKVVGGRGTRRIVIVKLSELRVAALEER